MKRILSFSLIVVGVFLLTACGKQDLSGTYFYEQTGVYSINGSPFIHQIVITKANDENTKYKVTEAIEVNPPSSEGTITIKDKNYLDWTMSESSNDINPSDKMPGLDISNLKDVKFEFKDEIITIGEAKFYKSTTSKGKKYESIYTGRATYEEAFK